MLPVQEPEEVESVMGIPKFLAVASVSSGISSSTASSTTATSDPLSFPLLLVVLGKTSILLLSSQLSVSISLSDLGSSIKIPEF